VIVEDLLMMNQVVKEIKENAELAVIIQPLENMKFAEDLSTKSNLLWWRSGKLQRVINSTLAAETQSLSKGLADLTWTIVIYKELRDEKM
ncbi:GABA transporter 1, partial [Durusdinium trenchii]